MWKRAAVQNRVKLSTGAGGRDGKCSRFPLNASRSLSSSIKATKIKMLVKNGNYSALDDDDDEEWCC